MLLSLIFNSRQGGLQILLKRDWAFNKAAGKSRNPAKKNHGMAFLPLQTITSAPPLSTIYSVQTLEERGTLLWYLFRPNTFRHNAYAVCLQRIITRNSTLYCRYDTRGQSHLEARHWSDEDVLGGRAFFRGDQERDWWFHLIPIPSSKP